MNQNETARAVRPALLGPVTDRGRSTERGREGSRVGLLRVQETQINLRRQREAMALAHMHGIMVQHAFKVVDEKWTLNRAVQETRRQENHGSEPRRVGQTY